MIQNQLGLASLFPAEERFFSSSIDIGKVCFALAPFAKALQVQPFENYLFQRN
ncbi:hypothetical protein ACP70R_013496 [Stipagrostis hirtigluma subsp. patula]